MYPTYIPRLQRIVEFLQQLFINGLLLAGGSAIVLYALQSVFAPSTVVVISTAMFWWMVILCASLVTALIFWRITETGNRENAMLLESERKIAKDHYPDEQEIVALKLQRNIYQMLLSLAYENGESDEDKDKLLDKIQVLGDEVERLASHMKPAQLYEARQREKVKMRAVILPFAGHP